MWEQAAARAMGGRERGSNSERGVGRGHAARDAGLGARHARTSERHGWVGPSGCIIIVYVI